MFKDQTAWNLWIIFFEKAYYSPCPACESQELKYLSMYCRMPVSMQKKPCSSTIFIKILQRPGLWA